MVRRKLSLFWSSLSSQYAANRLISYSNTVGYAGYLAISLVDSVEEWLLVFLSFFNK